MSDYNTGYNDGFQNGLRHAADLAKRQYLENKAIAKEKRSYHNCDNHQCYGCRADEAITIQTLLEEKVVRQEVQGE